MKKIQFLFVSSMLVGLLACSQDGADKKSRQLGYLNSEISQAELNNIGKFKRYSYTCRNFETGSTSYLAAYFPLWKESRLPQNFGFYFQLDGGKAQPFDHLENRALNRAGTRFEVRYHSYAAIDGSNVELKARERSSVYYKNSLPWLECREI